jgi:membrane protein required for beta-lactamase induction
MVLLITFGKVLLAMQNLRLSPSSSLVSGGNWPGCARLWKVRFVGSLGGIAVPPHFILALMQRTLQRVWFDWCNCSQQCTIRNCSTTGNGSVVASRSHSISGSTRGCPS